MYLLFILGETSKIISPIKTRIIKDIRVSEYMMSSGKASCFHETLGDLML